MQNDYIPISCSFYDELESAAVKGIDCEIIFKKDKEEKKAFSKVVDFKTIKKEEFMFLENGEKIRLDNIVLFNGISPQDKNYC